MQTPDRPTVPTQPNAPVKAPRIQTDDSPMKINWTSEADKQMRRADGEIKKRIRKHRERVPIHYSYMKRSNSCHDFGEARDILELTQSSVGSTGTVNSVHFEALGYKFNKIARGAKVFRRTLDQAPQAAMPPLVDMDQ